MTQVTGAVVDMTVGNRPNPWFGLSGIEERRNATEIVLFPESAAAGRNRW